MYVYLGILFGQAVIKDMSSMRDDMLVTIKKKKGFRRKL